MNGKEDIMKNFWRKVTPFGTGNGKVSKTVDIFRKKGTFIVTLTQGNKTTSKKIIIE